MMGKSRFAWTLLIVPIFVMLAGCGGGGDPRPGPIIIIKPPTSGASLAWGLDTDFDHAEDVALSGGPSITDSSDTTNYCNLRGDFIGTKVLEMSFDIKGGGMIADAGSITLSNTTHAVKISQKASDSDTVVEWKIYTKASGVLTLVCDGVGTLATGDYDEDKIPVEFIGFTKMTSVDSTGTEHEGEKVELQMEVK